MRNSSYFKLIGIFWCLRLFEEFFTKTNGQGTPVLGVPGFVKPGEITVADFQDSRFLWRGVAMTQEQLQFVNSAGFDANEITPGSNVTTVMDNLIPDDQLSLSAAPGVDSGGYSYTKSDTYGVFLIQDDGDLLFFGAPKRYALFYNGPSTPPIFIRRSNVKNAAFCSLGALGIVYNDGTAEILGISFEGADDPNGFYDWSIPSAVNGNITSIRASFYNIWFLKEETNQAFSKGFTDLGGLSPSAADDGYQLNNVRKLCASGQTTVVIFEDNSAVAFDSNAPLLKDALFMPIEYPPSLPGEETWVGAGPGSYVDCQADDDFPGPAIVVYANAGINYIIPRFFIIKPIPLQEGQFVMTGLDLIHINVNNTMRLMERVPYDFANNVFDGTFPLPLPTNLPVDNIDNSAAGTYVRTRYGLSFINNYTTVFFMGSTRSDYEPMNSAGQLLYGTKNLTLSAIKAEDQWIFTSFTNQSVQVRGPGETPELLLNLLNKGIINFDSVVAGSKLVLAKTFPIMMVNEAQAAGPLENCGPQFSDEDCWIGANGFESCTYIDCAEGFQCSKARGFICVERNLLPGEPCGNSAMDPSVSICQPGVACAPESPTALLGTSDLTVCNGVFSELRARVRVLTPFNDTAAASGTLGCNTLLDGVYDTCVPSQAFCDLSTRECIFNEDKENLATPVSVGQRCNVDGLPTRYCPAGLVCVESTKICENRTEPRQIGQSASFKTDYCVENAALAPNLGKCIDPNVDRRFFNTQRVLMVVFIFVLAIFVVISGCFFCSRRETIRILKHEILR